MSFTLPSYKDCLKKGKQMIEEALIPIRVSKTKAQAEIEQLKLQEEVLNLEVKIQEMEIKDPVPFEDMIAAMNKIELLQRKEFLLNKIISEMFPVEEKVKK